MFIKTQAQKVQNGCSYNGIVSTYQKNYQATTTRWNQCSESFVFSMSKNVNKV